MSLLTRDQLVEEYGDENVRRAEARIYLRGAMSLATLNAELRGASTEADSKIVHLVPLRDQKWPGSDGANPDTVAQLKLLLELAEQGKLDGFVYVVTGPDVTDPAVGYSGAHGRRGDLLIGLERLKNDIVGGVA